MPLDEPRPRTQAARPVVDEADDDLDDIDHGSEPNLTPERLKEIEAAHIADALESLAEYRANPELAIPWEDLRDTLFDPPTPEELAEEAAEEQSRRARR